MRELRTFEGIGVLSPDGQQVVTYTEEGAALRIWGPDTGERAFAAPEGHAVTAVRWVDDGSDAGLLLVTGRHQGADRVLACSPVGLECGALPVGEGEIRISR